METKSNKEIYDFFKSHKYLEYGSIIPVQLFRDVCGIETIEIGSRADFDNMALSELNYANYIRNKLLNEGKYLKGERDSYRILLPSENAGQIMSLMNSASNKLKRSIKLNSNTPAEYKIPTNDEVRIFMKNEDIKNQRQKMTKS